MWGKNDFRSGRLVQARYDRAAFLYDLCEGFMEWVGGWRWRRILWSQAKGGRVLEVGVGTGRNFPYYPSGLEVVAMDFSPRMLDRAKDKDSQGGHKVPLLLMDSERLGFRDAAFDSVVASYVFCSVPDPVAALGEVLRVTKPGGPVLLLEHTISAHRLLKLFMNWVNPVAVRLGGENINRDTVANVEKAGLRIERVTNLGSDVFKLIEARKL